MIRNYPKTIAANKLPINFINEYVILDLETTGLNPINDTIIEIGAIKVSNGIITNEFNSLINPKREISNFITGITGITNKMVSSAPTLINCLPSLLDFIEDKTVIAHNASFDIGFISCKTNTLLSKQFKNPSIDTVYISRVLLPGISHKLENLTKRLKLKTNGFHRAINDCYNTYYLYQYLNNFHNMYIKHIIQGNIPYVKENPIFDKVCVITGSLVGLSREEAAQIITNMGGTYSNTVTKKTNFLIVGEPDERIRSANQKSSKENKALQYILNGQDLKILSECEFYNILF